MVDPSHTATLPFQGWNCSKGQRLGLSKKLLGNTGLHPGANQFAPPSSVTLAASGPAWQGGRRPNPWMDQGGPRCEITSLPSTWIEREWFWLVRTGYSLFQNCPSNQ